MIQESDILSRESWPDLKMPAQRDLGRLISDPTLFISLLIKNPKRRQSCFLYSSCLGFKNYGVESVFPSFTNNVVVQNIYIGSRGQLEDKIEVIKKKKSRIFFDE